MAVKTVKFSVTQEDIESGVRGSVDDCPVAKCMTRTLGVPVVVDGADNCPGCWIWIHSDREDGGLAWSAPHAVWDFAKTYDEFGPAWVHPFDFELERIDLAGL